MQYEWDENKNTSNMNKHNISFEEAILIFDGPVLTYIDDRKEYLETRERSIGSIKEIVVAVVVHTKRNSRIRIISARTANNKERETYNDYIKKKIK